MDDSKKMYIHIICIAIGSIVIVYAQNCTHPNPSFNYTYTNFSCPVNTSCVVDDRFDPPNQLLTSVPVGCCPDNLTTGCFKNDAYTGLDGCCGPDQICCYTAAPLERRWLGCAETQNQCCFNQICPFNYTCCSTTFGHTCCPKGTTCFSENWEIYVNGNGLPPVNFTELLNVTFLEDLCIPIQGTFSPIRYILNNTNVTENREACEDFLGDLKPTEWMVELANLTDFATTKCGRHLCISNDTCVIRYTNATLLNYTLDINNPACVGNNPNPNYAYWWPKGCTNITRTLDLFEHPVGCCPANYTPCGQYDISFSPVPAELPQLWSPVAGMIGCAAPEETCCYPFICPSGMKCCSNKFTINGTGPVYPVNQTGRITPNFLMGSVEDPDTKGLMIKFGQTFNMCCPENTYCCQVEVPYPQHYGLKGEFFSFCGIDANCTIDAYRPNFITFSQDLTGQAIQQTESLLDVLSEGYIPPPSGSNKKAVCWMGYDDNKYYIRSCGQLGGDFQNPPTVNNPDIPITSSIPPITGKFLPNTGFTQQINAEEIYNVTMLRVPGIPPRPP